MAIHRLTTLQWQGSFMHIARGNRRGCMSLTPCPYSGTCRLTNWLDSIETKWVLLFPHTGSRLLPRPRLTGCLRPHRTRLPTTPRPKLRIRHASDWVSLLSPVHVQSADHYSPHCDRTPFADRACVISFSISNPLTYLYYTQYCMYCDQRMCGVVIKAIIF